MVEPIKYKTSEVATIFGVDSYSVIRWADDFSDQLDKDAKTEKNQARYFTDLDVRKIALICKLRKKRRPTKEIRARLSAGEVDDPPDDVTALAYVGSKIIPPHLQKRVALLESEIEKLKQENKTLYDSKMQSDAKVELLEKQLKEKQGELAQALIQIGQLKK